MNIFCSQSIQTQIELEEIADVKRQFILPSNSRTIIGLVQDGLLGAYNLTAPSMRIDWRNTMNIMSYTGIDDFSAIKKNKEYTGHELFSLIIPPKININKGNAFNVQNGKLLSGQLNQEALGAKKKNTLHQLIWDEYGPDQTQRFIDNAQKLANNFNLYNAMTVGIGDIAIKKDVEKQINKVFQTYDLKVEHMITDLENNPELMDNDLFERRLMAELNVVRDDVSKLLMANLDPLNNVSIMIKSGSKGDPTNYGQMSGCVGLQAAEGKLPQKKINGRSLPYFFQNDDRSEARGLVKPSFINGMGFPQFFFLNMAGREGLIDSAIKTASSGYIQRKLVKTLEDATMKYDCTVRTVNNNILQFVYGDTGANTIYQYDHPIKIINLNNSEIENKYKFTMQELKNFKFSEKDNEKYIQKLIELRDILRKSQFKSRMSYITMTDIFMIPVNLSRIVDSIKNDESLKTKEKLEPSYIIDEIEKLMTNDETKLILMNKSNKFKPQDERTCKTSFEVAVHDLIAPKRCVFEYNLSKTQFDEIVKQIKDSYNKNMMEPGEHVGIIAAQSMGEPTTQMTLNNFHHAGIAAVSTTTQGVPRVQELLSLSKNIKTPQMIIYLNDEYSKSYEMAKKIASYIKFTTLGHIRSKINVYYDPNPYEKGGFMEQDNVYNIYYSHNPSKNSCQADINNLPWLMRIELDREKLIDKEVTLLDIKSKFCNQWEKRYNDLKGIKKEEKAILDKIVQTALLSNTDNDKTPIIHLRFDMTDFEITTINNFIEFMIDKFKLKGIPSIHDISTITEERALSYDKKDGSLIEGNQWVIYTQGENLYDIRYLTGIDVYKTICNDVVQVYQTFGIEAARATIIREITYAYERASQTVNYHHLSILVDLMTSSGQLTSVDRHGMSKTDNDVLARASFEKMVDQVINAAIFGEVDHMKGVSSRIMAGLVVRGGTGMCDVILDTKALEKSEFIEDIQQNYNKTYKDITANTIISDVINKEDAGDIFMPM